MKYASIITIIAIFIYLVFSTAQAIAVSPADFPSCSNPQGSERASYTSGTHGIAGSMGEHTGSDKVYTIDGQKVLQCFCPFDGMGIQTNWLKADNLSQDEIKVYQSQGWILIASGKAWGLDEEPYLANNQDFSCNAPSANSGGSQSSSNGGSSNGTSTGIVEASTAVLGLAGTGNTMTLLAVAITGLVAFLLSFFLKRAK